MLLVDDSVHSNHGTQTSEARCVWIDCESNGGVFVNPRFWGLSLKQFLEIQFSLLLFDLTPVINVSISLKSTEFGCY